MRIAVAGKGGAGKTTISATLARLEGRQGRNVVAVDADSNPNLAVALGVATDQMASSAPMPTSVVSRRLDGGAALNRPVADVVDDHSVSAPDGVRLMVLGAPDHAGMGCLCAAHATVAALLSDMAAFPATTIVDLEASPEHLSRGTAAAADVLVLVAEPYFRSLEAVRRLAVLAGELPIPHVVVVANKVRAHRDAAVIAAFCEDHRIGYVGEIPWSDAVLDADGRAVPLVDAAPDDATVSAIGRLGNQLRAFDSHVGSP